MHTAILFLAVAAAPDARDADARAALALAAASKAPALCNCTGPGNCVCVGRDGRPCNCPECLAEPVYQWRVSKESPRFLLLRRGGALVGCYDIENGFYWAWNAARGEYEERFTLPPTDVPPGFISPRKAAQAQPLYLSEFFQGGAYCPPGASS